MTKYTPHKGDILYACREHMYYPKKPDGTRGLVETEYIVTEEIVCDFFHPPKGSSLQRKFITLCNISDTGKLRKPDEEEMKRHGLPLYGGTPTQWGYGQIGKQIFLTPEEAAEIAREKSDAHDRTWSIPYGKPPCRRTQWKMYLESH